MKRFLVLPAGLLQSQMIMDRDLVSIFGDFWGKCEASSFLFFFFSKLEVYYLRQWLYIFTPHSGLQVTSPPGVIHGWWFFSSFSSSYSAHSRAQIPIAKFDVSKIVLTSNELSVQTIVGDYSAFHLSDMSQLAQSVLTKHCEHWWQSTFRQHNFVCCPAHLFHYIPSSLLRYRRWTFFCIRCWSAYVCRDLPNASVYLFIESYL